MSELKINFKYNAFISYSWKEDSIFASAIQRSLQQFAKPIWQRRSVNIFRDKENQSIGQVLSHSILDAILNSEYLILCASQKAANSEWVQEEVTYWCHNKPLDKLLILQTDGDIYWDKINNDFNWSKTKALPKVLQGQFHECPIWLDVRSIKSGSDFSINNLEFKDIIGSLSSTIRDVPKTEIIGFDMSIQKKSRRLRRGAITMIILLFSLFVLAGLRAYNERIESLISQSKFLANASTNALNEGKSGLAVRLAVAGFPETNKVFGMFNQPTIPEIETALFRAVTANQELFKLQGHSDIINSVCFNSDGSQILTASRDGTVKIWNARTGEIIKSFVGHEGEVHMAIYSQDGQNIVSCASDRTIRVWEVESGELIDLMVPSNWVNFIHFTPDGQFLISANLLGEGISLWDLSKAQLIRNVGFDQTVVGISPDCLIGVTSNSLRTIGDKLVIWDLLSGKPVSELKVIDSHTIKIASFSPDCDKMVLSSNLITGPKVRLLDIKSGSLIANLIGPKMQLNSAAFSSDGKSLLTSSYSQLYLWNGINGELVKELTGHTESVYGIDYLSQHHIFASASHDQTIRIWDASTGKQLSVLTGHESGINHIDFNHQGTLLVSGSSDYTARVWKVTSDSGLSINDPEATAISYTFSNDDSQLTVIYNDGKLRTLDVDNGNILGEFQVSGDKITAFDFNSTLHFVAISDLQLNTRVYDYLEKKEIAVLPGQKDSNHLSFIVQVVINPAGTRIATATDRGKCNLWSLPQGKLIKEWMSHEKYINSLFFKQNGNQIVSSSSDGTIKVWDSVSGNLLHDISNNIAMIGMIFQRIPIAFSNDNNISQDSAVWVNFVSPSKPAAAAGLQSNDIIVKWDNESFHFFEMDQKLNRLKDGNGIQLEILRNGELLEIELTPKNFPSGPIEITDFDSSTNRMLAINDKEIEIWNAESGEKFKSLNGSFEYISAAYFFNNGRQIISSDGSSSQHRIRLWDVNSGNQVNEFTVPFQVDDLLMTHNGNTVITNVGAGALWNLESGEFLRLFIGETTDSNSVQTKVSNLILSHDGTTLVGSDKQNIYIWPILPFGKDLFNLVLDERPQILTEAEIERKNLTMN